MKIKTTKRELNYLYDYVIRAGYCELQHLLKAPSSKIQERFYSCGVYGWNWDGYEITTKHGTVCVCTGYRDMTGEKIKGLERFEKRAKNLWSWDNKKTFTEKKQAHNRIINDFVKYVIKNY